MKRILKKIAAHITAYLNLLGEDYEMELVDYRTAFYADESLFDAMEDGLLV